MRRDSGLASPEELHESRIEVRLHESELLAVHEVIDRLAGIDEAAARLVKLRFFVGMNMGETAEALGLSLRQAERLWTFAKAWLRDALRGEG